jgi:hypothetical protein
MDWWFIKSLWATLPRPLEEFGGSHWWFNYDGVNTHYVRSTEMEVLLLMNHGTWSYMLHVYPREPR